MARRPPIRRPSSGRRPGSTRPISGRRPRRAGFGARMVPVVYFFLLVLAGVYLFQAWQDGRIKVPGLPPPLTPTSSAPAHTATAPSATAPSATAPSATAPAAAGSPLPTLAFTPTAAAAAPAEAGAGEPLAVYFTDPHAGLTAGGLADLLIEAVDRAQQSVDVAVYNLSLEDLADALLRARERGVRVRLVMESDALDRRVPARLRDSGLPITGDEGDGLMHNKFMIVDGREVWTGSMNFTGASAWQDYNNLLRLVSPQVVENYTTEFEEMFVEGLFGANYRPATPHPLVEVGGVPVEIYFSPDDGAAEEIIAEILSAQTSIEFMAYSFTSDDIAAAMREQAAAGVTVRGVFDEEQARSNQGGEFDAFVDDGFDVHTDGLDGLMHHKVIIIDGRTVITGSYNFSASAERRNDENVLIIHSPVLAAQYQAHFAQVYAEAAP